MYQQQPPQYGGQPPQQYQQPPQQDLFVGSGKVRQAPFGQVMRFSLSRNDLEKLMACLNEQDWVSFEIMAKRQPSQSGATHYGKIDLWQPQPQQQYGQPQPQGYYAPQPQQQYGQPPQMPRNPYPTHSSMPARQQPQYQQPDNGGFASPPAPGGYPQPSRYTDADCPPPMQGQPPQMPPMPPAGEPQEDGIPF